MSSFVQIRRGILEHVENGQISGRDFMVYCLILLKADKATGVWRGSSKAIAATFGAGDIPERMAKESLRSLEDHGYIKRFMTPGKRGNYAILVDKYLVTVGVLKGKRVSAEQTVNWHKPVCVAGPDEVPEDVPEGVPERVPEDVPLSRPQEHKTSTPKEASSALTGRSLAKSLLILLDTPQEYNNPATLDEWSEQLAGIIRPDGPFDSVELSRALQWALTRDKFWPTRIFKAKNVVDNAESLIGQFRGQKKAQKNAAEPAAAPKPKSETKPQQSTYDWRRNAKLVSQP